MATLFCTIKNKPLPFILNPILKFIDKKVNIILIGTPGSGKTHYATALGIKACMKGKNILFAQVPNLVIDLQEAMGKNQITAYKKSLKNMIW